MRFDIFTITRRFPKSWNDRVCNTIGWIEEQFLRPRIIMAFEFSWESPLSRINGCYWWFPTVWGGRARDLEKPKKSGMHWKVYNLGASFLGFMLGVGFSYKIKLEETLDVCT